MKDSYKKLLKACRPYVKEANERAEARHDSPDGEYYMDGGQYEIMRKTEDLLRRIDLALNGGLLLDYAKRIGNAESLLENSGRLPQEGREDEGLQDEGGQDREQPTD